MFFMNKCELLQIVDNHIVNEENVGQIMEVANVAEQWGWKD